MHPFESRIEKTIAENNLLRKTSPVIVALSGGADSVALLSVLVSLGYDCIAAHCNFHLRGAESVRDMRHAEAVARKLGVNIYIREFNVGERIRKTGESVEMACRELRYSWFHELLDRDYSQAIAVAHHREDNIETFFINLLRSSGLAGLTGMDYRRGYVVRPMLDESRREIERYLSDIGLDFVSDSTNNQNDFVRNRLRNVVIPNFEEQFPGAGNAVLAAMTHLRDSRNLLESLISKSRNAVELEDKALDIAALLAGYDSETGRLMLFEILRPMGLNMTQTDAIARAVITGNTGLRFDIDSNRFAELDRGILSFRERKTLASGDAVFPVNLKHDILHPVNIEVTPHDVVEFKPERDADVMYLDMRALEDNATFTLRHPRTGDKLKPYGMKGEKLISDILKDAKMSAHQKRNTWLLTRNGKVLWIVGLRASSHFTVSPATRRYLRLKLNR